MSLSRTARILLALLLVAAAAFVWVNYFADTPADPPGPTVQEPAPTAPAEPGVPPDADDATAEGEAEPAAPDEPGAIADLPTVAPEAPPDPAAEPTDPAVAPADDAPPVVVAPPADGPADPDAPAIVVGPDGATVGRAVTAAELPFLITAPPAPDAVAEVDPDDPTAPGRPGTAVRATVNPFSPIVVQQPTDPVAEAPAAAEPDVVEVDVPEAPPVDTVEAAPPPTPQAPAPSPVAPAEAATRDLPRPLPSGVLSTAPSLLTTPRAVQSPRVPDAVPDLAPAREPDAPPTPTRLDTVPADDAQATDTPAPLAPGQVPAAGVPDQPLVAGTDGLSRYLRNQNVVFTGSVLGSVGVGVFRTSDRERPVVLALGQTLPETEIVLTDLRGQSAEFTLGDTSHLLHLDLRR